MKAIRWNSFLLVTMLVFLILGNIMVIAGSSMVPLNQESLASMLRKTVEVKMIPCEMKSKDTTVNITKLLDFSMDWEKSELTLACEFSAEYRKFINVKTGGEVSLKGTGLLSANEQKIGVKIIELNTLKLKQSNSMIDDVVRSLLNKSLSGKEMWQGEPPKTSEPITKDNYTTLLQVVINQSLPMEGEDNKSSFSMEHLNSLKALSDPGQFEANFDLKGTYNLLGKKKYEGKATILIHVLVDPEALAGVIQIDKLTGLDLKGYPGFLDGIIRALMNGKLKGKEMPFAWK